MRIPVYMLRYRRFVLSLKESGFQGDLVIGVDGHTFQNDTIMSFLREHKVIVRDVSHDEAVPAHLRTTGTTSTSTDHGNRHWGKMIRYYAYMGWSQLSRYRGRKILLVDFRDVFFQSDPFAAISFTANEWLRFYEEFYPPNLLESKFTYGWIQECWGEEAARKLAKAAVLCSGAVMGTSGILDQDLLICMRFDYSSLKVDLWSIDRRRTNL